MSDFRQGDQLTANGWIVDVTTSNTQYNAQCGNRAWFGWKGGNAVGSVSATFTGSGKAVLIFGNCWTRGNVEAYLNNKMIGAVQNFGNKTIEFTFSKGDVLTIEEQNTALIQLHKLAIECGGKELVNFNKTFRN